MNAKYWPCDFVNSYSDNRFVRRYQPSNVRHQPRRSRIARRRLHAKLGLFLWSKISDQSHFGFHNLVDELSHIPARTSREAFNLFLQSCSEIDWETDVRVLSVELSTFRS